MGDLPRRVRTAASGFVRRWRSWSTPTPWRRLGERLAILGRVPFRLVHFGIDRVEERYEALQGKAIEVPPSVELLPPRPVRGASRRKALQVLGALAGTAWLGLHGLTGCDGENATGDGLAPADAGPTRLPLAPLRPGERIRILEAGRPVEVRRTAEGVVARSLVCTHFGCEVRWNEERQEYLCPCHGGVYDADGRPIAGPPDRPLVELAVEVDGDSVVVTG